MKPFDLEAAKAGAKLLSEGREIQIVSYNYAHPVYRILGIFTNDDGLEETRIFTINGEFVDDQNSIYDLVMAPEVKSAWFWLHNGQAYWNENKPYDPENHIAVHQHTWEE